MYQKAYLEFFVSPENLKKIIETAKQFPALTYHATNAKGETFTNVHSEKGRLAPYVVLCSKSCASLLYVRYISLFAGVNAVTWGVFPAKEIIQPTVVDPASFMVWKVGSS